MSQFPEDNGVVLSTPQLPSSAQDWHLNDILQDKAKKKKYNFLELVSLLHNFINLKRVDCRYPEYFIYLWLLNCGLQLQIRAVLF